MTVENALPKNSMSWSYYCVLFLGKSGKSYIEAPFPKVIFKTVSLYLAQVYLLVAATLDTLPIAHHSFTSFPALLKWCLERLRPLQVPRWPRGRAGREQATTPTLLMAPTAKSAHEQGHPPHHKEHKMRSGGIYPLSRMVRRMLVLKE